MEELNQLLKNQGGKTEEQKKLKKIQQELPRLEKYEQQQKLLAGRNSYSRTDVAASSLRMKEDRAAQKPLARPAYNVQIGTESQFILGYSLHPSAGDTNCFIGHMERQEFLKQHPPHNLSADAGYGSEENYAYLETRQIGNFMKYNTFYQEQHPPRKAELVEQARFRSVNFPYDPARDEFTCPAQHPLTYRETKPYKTSNGYLSRHPCYFFKGFVPNAVFTKVRIVPPVRSNRNVHALKAIAAFKSVLNSSAIEATLEPIYCPSRA